MHMIKSFQFSVNTSNLHCIKTGITHATTQFASQIIKSMSCRMIIKLLSFLTKFGIIHYTNQNEVKGIDCVWHSICGNHLK